MYICMYAIKFFVSKKNLNWVDYCGYSQKEKLEGLNGPMRIGAGEGIKGIRAMKVGID